MRKYKLKLKNEKLKAQNAILTKQNTALLDQKKFVKKKQKQLYSVDEGFPIPLAKFTMYMMTATLCKHVSPVMSILAETTTELPTTTRNHNTR